VPSLLQTIPKPRTSVRPAEYFYHALLTSYYSVKRAAKNIFSDAQSVVDEYNNALDELMQEFRDRAVRDTHIHVHRVLDLMEDLSLDSMAYAGGAGLNDEEMPGWNEGGNSESNRGLD